MKESLGVTDKSQEFRSRIGSLLGDILLVKDDNSGATRSRLGLMLLFERLAYSQHPL